MKGLWFRDMGFMNPELRNYRFELRISVFTQALEAEDGPLHEPLPWHTGSEQDPTILRSLHSNMFGLFSFARAGALDQPRE